jgi:hypothetical protein
MKDYYREQRNKGILMILIISGILMMLSCCTTTKKCCDKEHVITEYDGNRQINWYSTKTNNNKK